MSMKPEDDKDYLYHKMMIDRGMARCVLHSKGRPGFTYMRKEHAGKQIAWSVYSTGKLPLHALPHQEGDSYQAVGFMLAKQTMRNIAPEPEYTEQRYADGF